MVISCAFHFYVLFLLHRHITSDGHISLILFLMVVVGGGLNVFNLELGLAAARGDLGVFVGSVEVEELGGAVVPVADYFC